MEEFIIHPLVYPTVESIIRDIHFKTFKKFEGKIIFPQLKIDYLNKKLYNISNYKAL